MSAAVLSKITPPNLDGVIEREPCFRTIDNSLKKRVVWITAPGGSGKTTLAASYLKNRGHGFIWYHMDETDIDAATFFYYMTLAVTNLPLRKKPELPGFSSEYFNNVRGFAVRYFNDIFSRLKESVNSAGSCAPFVIVFDNYQNLPVDSIVHDIIARHLLSALPDGFTSIVLSRGEPTIEFAEIRRNDGLGFIEWNDLLFTLDDTLKLVRASTESEISEETIRRLHKKMDGWAAGLVLAIEQGDIAASMDGFESMDANEAVFDYFAGEIFENTDPIERECLLKTSYLKEFNLSMAEKLTGCTQSHKILSRKHRQFFITQKQTDKGLMFQYHDLFQDFLRTHSKDYFDTQREGEIVRRAVDILEENGNFEAAAELCIGISDAERLHALVLKYVEPSIAHGKAAMLNKWFAGFPADFLENQPRLLYWRGMNKLQSNPAEARKDLEFAYARFKSIDDPDGLFCAFCAIVDTYVYEWEDFHPLDDWIDEFDRMAKHYRIMSNHAVSIELRRRIVISIFSALIFRQPNHPDMSYWEKEAVEILHSSQNLMQLMSLGHTIALYYLWTGKIYKAGIIVDLLSPVIDKTKGHVLPRLMFYRTKSLYLYYSASYKQSLNLIEESLKLAKEYDMHMLDLMFYGTGIYNSISIGNNEIIEDYFRKMESSMDGVQCFSHIYYHNIASLVALSRRDYSSAIEYASTAIKLAIKSGFSPLVVGFYEYFLAMILSEAGLYDEARRHIRESFNLSTATGRILFEYACRTLEALIALHENDDEQFAEKMTIAVGASKTMGPRLAVMPQSSVKRLCVAALERNIEPDFIRAWIRDHDITPDGYRHDDWPYPLKIHTLGKFEITIDGKIVKRSGKTQKKPLEILKAIIALGGKDIGVTQLSDALWPDADGDAAATSFNTTLHRLRKLLMVDYNIILLSDGYLSINPNYCWIDIWAFQDIIDGFRKMLALPNCEQEIYRLFIKAKNIYKGGFLPGDLDQSWSAHLRERLKDDFVNLCCKTGTYFESVNDWDKGIECYKSALEADDLREECYRRTIAFYLKAGMKPEAVAMYERCRHVLETKLCISPSAETSRLVDSITLKVSGGDLH